VLYQRRSLPTVGGGGQTAPKRSASSAAFQPIVGFGARNRSKSADVPRPGMLPGSAASSGLAQVCASQRSARTTNQTRLTLHFAVTALSLLQFCLLPQR